MPPRLAPLLVGDCRATAAARVVVQEEGQRANPRVRIRERAFRLEHVLQTRVVASATVLQSQAEIRELGGIELRVCRSGGPVLLELYGLLGLGIGGRGGDGIGSGGNGRRGHELVFLFCLSDYICVESFSCEAIF